jgi:ATP-dependent Clp protease adaptor protein ClpS
MAPKAGPAYEPVDEKKPAREEGDVAVAEARPKLKEPPHYAVVLHNDDYTTMEFVTEVLQRYFHKTGEEAVQIMLKVHQQGKGVAGTYTYQIAETKVAQVGAYAEAKSFPLRCTVEPA